MKGKKNVSSPFVLNRRYYSIRNSFLLQQGSASWQKVDFFCLPDQRRRKVLLQAAVIWDRLSYRKQSQQHYHLLISTVTTMTSTRRPTFEIRRQKVQSLRAHLKEGRFFRGAEERRQFLFGIHLTFTAFVPSAALGSFMSFGGPLNSFFFFPSSFRHILFCSSCLDKLPTPSVIKRPLLSIRKPMAEILSSFLAQGLTL